MAEKIVIITGGYGYLGQEFAKGFIQNDDTVIITGRDKDKLEDAAQSLGCDSFVHDVSDESQTIGLKNYISDTHGKIDVLINNAGLMRSKPVEEMEPDLFKSVIKINLYGSFLCTHVLLPLVKHSESGLIINVASTSGHRADPGSAAYNASKFGLLGFTEALRKEVRKYDIRVTSISPSSIYYGHAPDSGKAVGLNGADIAEAAVYLSQSKGRALFRDLEMWGTNP